MNSDSTASKYAGALFDIGKGAGKLDIFQANASDFLRVLQSSGDLKISLSHPNIRRAQRKEIIDAVLAKCSYDRLFNNFIKLVVDRGRIQYYPKIVAEFIGLRDEAAGRIHGHVYVASSLSAEQHEKLRAKVQKQLGCEVVIDEHIEPDIIGGMRLEINGRVYDSSIKYHLERMQNAMLHK